MKRMKGGWAALLRRIAALSLVLLLGLQLLPGHALAAEGDGTKTSAVTWKTMDNTQKAVSAGKAVTNTYILEVSSGTRQGGGTAENVLYFIIHYTTDKNEQRTLVLVPGEDAISKGFDAAAAQGNRNARRQEVYDVFGYNTAELNTKKGLGSVATDQFMFTTVDKVERFDKIQIFGKRNEEHGNWSCQGMHIYRVDTLFGLEMYGWYSDTGFIDFAGALVCDVVMPLGGATFKWTSSAGIYEVTPTSSKATLYMMPNGGTRVESQLHNRVVFRIDFADVAGAGFESLAGVYTEGKTRISELRFCETAAINIRYTDVYGCVREVALPLVINALGQIMEVLGDAYIAEFAQQGDTIAIPATLPYFKSLDSVNLALGEEKAAAAAYIVTGTVKFVSTSNTPVVDEVYYLSPANNPTKRLTLDAASSAVIVAEGTARRWKVTKELDGTLYLADPSDENQVLSINMGTGSVKNGMLAELKTKKTNGSENQRWELKEVGDGSYALISCMPTNPKYCLDVSQSTGKKVQAWTYNGTSNQHWLFKNVNNNSDTTQIVVENVDIKTDPRRVKRVNDSKSDDISYLCIAAYTDVTVQVGLEGATLRTRFVGGTPVKLATATSAEGVPLAANQTVPILLRDFTAGMKLLPKDRTERYLITISTDNVPNAGTAGDIYLQFDYISVQDKELTSAEYKVRDYVREFYGQWPGNTLDFAYNYGFRDGGTVQFMIPLQGVSKFRNVSIRLEGDDEWQFSGLTIAMVQMPDAETGERAYSARLADWQEIAVKNLNNHPEGLYSHLVYTRDVATDGECFTLGTVYESEEDRPDPAVEDSGWVPGTLVQDDGDTYTFDGESKDVTKKDDVPWDKLRHYMTYNDALQDLGFTKERCSYTVSVQVAGKTVNAGNDDCGSKNLFYFRLIFENGNSGCTLANQQIVGDAFGTGELVQFKIPTSQDYGEVVAVQVIPDSQDSNSDIYDKLQIEEINVTRDTVDAVSPTWTAKIATASEEGWVGIDYRDPGEYGSNAGAQGRSLSELATTFPITETSYSTNLLVTITTADYPTGVQFSGGVSMDLNFINAEGRSDPRPISGYDVVEAMNAYGGLPGSQTRKYKIGAENVTEKVDYYVSDSRYQFLPGSEDSFLVTIKNVYQLTDMTLTVRSDTVTQWTIKNVTIKQLRGRGIRYLNYTGAYAYRYKKGEEPVLVAVWEPEEVTTPLQVFSVTQNTSMKAISFALDSETIQLSADAAKWSSKITRVPNSSNDTLNLILYPTMAGAAADPEDYEVVAAVKYTDTLTSQTMQVSTGQMKRGTDDKGNTVFYAVGLGAKNLESIMGVYWSATILRQAQPSIPDGVLQVVRGGVLIESYPLTGVGNSLYTAVGTTATSTQRVLLQLSEDTEKQVVKENTSDLAVALYYRTDDPSGLEYRSKYVFLSDYYAGVRPGQVLELDFNLGNVGELTGVNLVSMGKLDVGISSIYVADQAADGSIRAEKFISAPVSPGPSPLRAGFDGSVSLLTLELTTAEDTAAVSAGTKDPIRANIGYYDIYGYPKTLPVEDIRLYCDADKAFAAGAEDTVRLMIPDFGELRWIELEPWHRDENEEPRWSGDGPAEPKENPASWKLYSISAAVGLTGRPVSRTVDQRILEGEPLRIGLSDVLLRGTVTGTPPKAEGAEEGFEPQTETGEKITLSTGELKSLTVDSGSEILLEVKLSGSDEGFGVTLQTVNQETGELERGYIDETHGYSQEELKAILAEAEASAAAALSDAEREAAEAVAAAATQLMKTTGKWTNKSATETVFTPPRNYTGSRIVYRLTVSSKEIPEVSFAVDVAVRSEEDPLVKALETWNAVRTAGVIRVMDADGSAEDTVGILYGGSRTQLLRSGGSLEIEPHLSESSNFAADVRDLDPVTGATGQADLGPTHGYSEEKLEALASEAEDLLEDPESTDEICAAARAVLSAIDLVRDTEGSFGGSGRVVRFEAPRNYTGGILYYRITVTAAGTGETILTVDVSVRAEDNPLTAALSQLETAKSNALIMKQTEAIQDAIENAGGDTYYVIGDGEGNKSETGETGENGNAGDNGETGEPGEAGDNGETGESGDTGDTGDAGDTGDTGETGDADDSGGAGDTGGTGDTGDAGEEG